jgi:hypothetical protein
MRAAVVAGTLALALAGAQVAAQTAPLAEVAVVATLHQFHTRVPAYGYAELARAVEVLQPKVLALELMQQEVGARTAPATRQEYPKAIFPLIDRAPYWVVPLEPSGPARTRLLEQNAAADRAFLREAPEQAKAFDAYVSQLFSYLVERWHTPCDVNSSETDALLEVKHRFQDAITPASQAAAWQGWNQYLLSQVRQAAAQHRGKRIVVLVGVEHAYWLRLQLAVDPGVKLLDTHALLAADPGICKP